MILHSKGSTHHAETAKQAGVHRKGGREFFTQPNNVKLETAQTTTTTADVKLETETEI